MSLQSFSSFIAGVAAIFCAGSAAAGASRITQPIDNRQRITLTGHLHPKALAAKDQGPVAPSLPIPYLTLSLRPSASQQADLEALLVEQQAPGSPDYHRWLTPEEYGQRFGASPADLAIIARWLRDQGLNVVSVARGRNWIAASGTAAQVEAAFQVEIHTYAAGGETHFANASEPSVPAALAPVVKGIRGLNDFRMKPRRASLAKPHYTSGSTHYIAPDDLAAIYDIALLYAGGTNGNGQKIAIAGQTEINLSDIQTFRSQFNLTANNPQTLLVPGSKNPGVLSASGDLAESDVDLEWSGAVARNATIVFVYSTDVMESVQYAIDEKIAPVVVVTYGACEPETPAAEWDAFRQWAQQGNAQGITWLAASGDDGGADCADSQNPGLSVDLPGSVPEVTSVGGTEFAEGSGSYWNRTNNANQASALSYIPETTWNDSLVEGGPAAGGGGSSVLFAKPAWQTGPGVPNDKARDVPDVSLNASPDHDGYLVYTGGSLQVYGGTSVGAPVFAGLTVLLNQATGSGGAGNINPNLYALAQSSPSFFHDITAGNNIVTVPCGRNCTGTPVGYAAGVGYDRATGLGSVDAAKLVAGWNGATPPGSGASLTLLADPDTVAANAVVYLMATVASADGTTPSGSVAFSMAGTALGSAALTGSAGTATATLVLDGSQLPLGTGTITATYAGTASASATIAVTGSGSGANPVIGGVANAASFTPNVSPGSLLSVFGLQLSPAIEIASTVPLPISASGVAVLVNGIAAPLYYVSPGQLNVQIPYETQANTTALLSVNNNGQVTNQSFQVFPVAPGIFTDSSGALVPAATAAGGQEIAFYITGAGAVSPAVSTGAAPSSSTALANLPQPIETTMVTIGGAVAAIDFIGIPSGLVGVTQINVQVPNGIPTGAQPVVVTVGGTASAPATIVITD